MSLKYVSIEKLCHAKIINSNWLIIAMFLETSNQSVHISAKRSYTALKHWLLLSNNNAIFVLSVKAFLGNEREGVLFNKVYICGIKIIFYERLALLCRLWHAILSLPLP